MFKKDKSCYVNIHTTIDNNYSFTLKHILKQSLEISCFNLNK